MQHFILPAVSRLRRYGKIGFSTPAVQTSGVRQDEQVQKVLAASPSREGGVQTKLKVSAPRDPLEREADTVAERVVEGGAPDVGAGAATPRLDRLCDDCEEELQRQADAGDREPLYAEQPHLSGGRPLSAPMRNYFEPRFGADFGKVRLHTDSATARYAESINAKAFTYRNHIGFSTGGLRDDTAGKRLLAHELTHVVQQTGKGGVQSHLQRSVSDDIRTESELPPSQRTPGRLGQLETRARTEADEFFQAVTGQPSLQPGTTGRATQVVNHVVQQIGQMDNARARGYQQAVSAILGQQTLNTSQASSFWLAFAGNTLWALSGLVPLLGPTIGVSRIALAAGGGVLLRSNAIGNFLKAGGGAVATSVVGVAGAELAQFSGGTPSGSSLPRNLQDIQTTFTNVNSRVMSRYRSEAFALTRELIQVLPLFVDPANTATITPDFVEALTKGLVMETLFADLNAQGILDRSNHTVDTGRAQAAAKEDLLQAFVLRFGTVRDVAFQSGDEIGNRLGATGTSAALAALGGEAAFAAGLPGSHALVVGNINGVLADWGAKNTLPLRTQNNWSSGTALASGTHTVSFDIENKSQFAAQLDGSNYDPLTRGVSRIRSLRNRGAHWSTSVLPSAGTASFSSADYRSVSAGSRTVFGLQKITFEFSPSGEFRSSLSPPPSTVPSGRPGPVAVFRFSGNPEQVKVSISHEVLF